MEKSEVMDISRLSIHCTDYKSISILKSMHYDKVLTILNVYVFLSAVTVRMWIQTSTNHAATFYMNPGKRGLGKWGLGKKGPKKLEPGKKGPTGFCKMEKWGLIIFFLNLACVSLN